MILRIPSYFCATPTHTGRALVPLHVTLYTDRPVVMANDERVNGVSLRVHEPVRVDENVVPYVQIKIKSILCK
ncbi:hypothetical protein DPMN_048185 [Dreissena polymorpha]|uniref:Uncharacterized protein n=1 Tax=Dreissena polymorpha TaxID=45954 RepID=A0A9D4HZW4_DREPO|nr:hypothetical protein DPMN_048185 [Dreissena polymorpha]